MKSVIAGSRGMALGAAFEDSLDQHAHEAYRHHGIADICKLPVPTRSIGINRRVLTSRQRYDFEGRLGPMAGPTQAPSAYHGSAIVMESKATGSSKTSLAITKSTKNTGISGHQLEALAIATCMWGAVGVVVWKNGDKRLVLTPDRVIKANAIYQQGGRKSIPADEFVAYDRAEYPGYGKIEDWLYPVRCWIENNGLPSATMAAVWSGMPMQYKIEDGKLYIRETAGEDRPWECLGSPAVVHHRSILDQIATESKDAEAFRKAVGQFKHASD
jgi:hypothetical protein